jgi:hypothetical protein
VRKGRDIPELGIASTGSISGVAAFRGIRSPRLADGSVASRFRCFRGSAVETAFFWEDNSWPRLGDENGFLLGTPPGPGGCCGVGDSLAELDGVGAYVFYAERALWRTNS